MRTHVSIFTWLIRRNGVDIGTIRKSVQQLQNAGSINHTKGDSNETLLINAIRIDERAIEVA